MRADGKVTAGRSRRYSMPLWASEILQRGRLVAFRSRLICLHSGAWFGNAPPYMPR